MKFQYSLRLPNAALASALRQDEAFFEFDEGKSTRRLRFHDYGEIFNRPGLYEHLFHRVLRCSSPRTVVGLLDRVVTESGCDFGAIEALDLGAGNGLVGAELVSYGASRVVGVDILPEARIAAERDRPGTYDAYFTVDLCRLSEKVAAEIRERRCNALVCVAALGFDDVPPLAFVNALNMTTPTAWVAFNLKDSFFGAEDQTGFANLLRRLISGGWLQVLHLERYRHRLSVAGQPLHYYAVVGRKLGEVPLEVLSDIDRNESRSSRRSS